MPAWITGELVQFAGWLLVSTVLWFMVLKVWMPFAPKVEGQVLHQSRLRLRQKLLLHRTNLYLLSLLLLLGSLPGPGGTPLLPPVAYLLAAVVVVFVLGLPVGYTFTDRGLVLGAGVFGAHALFRAWREFRRYHIREQGIMLEGRPRRYASYLIVADEDQQREIRRLLKRYLR